MIAYDNKIKHWREFSSLALYQIEANKFSCWIMMGYKHWCSICKSKKVHKYNDQDWIYKKEKLPGKLLLSAWTAVNPKWFNVTVKTINMYTFLIIMDSLHTDSASE